MFLARKIDPERGEVHGDFWACDSKDEARKAAGISTGTVVRLWAVPDGSDMDELDNEMTWGGQPDEAVVWLFGRPYVIERPVTGQPPL